MVKSNNFESIRKLLILIFLFSAIMACALSPRRVYASGSVNPALNAAGEKIATFDDEEANFDSDKLEPATNDSSLLHAEHYHPPVFFAERQKRSVTSYSWMHIVSFAALLMLAFATTRFLGKRRQKSVLVENRVASEKITAVSVLIFLIIMFTAGVSNALVYSSVKDAVVSFLGEGREVFQTGINITPEVKQMLKKKLEWEVLDSSIKAYYSKKQDGTVDAYAFILSEKLAVCGGVHKYCIKVSSNGQVEGVKILELTCDRSYCINTKAFLNHFKAFNTANADKMKYDAITGATLSTHLTHNVVRRALVLFSLLKG
jgi:hypothetical protein